MATFGFTVRKKSGQFSGTRVIDVRPEDGGKTTIVRCTDKFDQMIADADAGYLFVDAVANA
jgi:hypothetical protein